MDSDSGVNKPVDNNENEDVTFVDMEGLDDDEKTIVDIECETEEKPVEDGQTDIFGFLIIRNGEHRGRVYQVKSGTTVGRNEGDIIIRDPQMSRKHVKIFVKKGEFYIEDLKTINKTSINGKVITKSTKVKQDDLILIGETEFEFKVLH